MPCSELVQCHHGQDGYLEGYLQQQGAKPLKGTHGPTLLAVTGPPSRLQKCIPLGPVRYMHFRIWESYRLKLHV